MEEDKMIDAFQNYLKLNLDAKKSRLTYLGQVKTFFKQFSEFNQENLNKYLALKIEQGISKSTFNIMLNAFKHLAKCLNLQLEFPKQKKCGLKMRNFITQNELDNEILPYFNLIFQDYEFCKFIIAFLFYTGLRTNELINLQVNDIDFKNCLLIIRNPKDKDDREIPFPPEFKKEIQRWLNQENKAFNITYEKIFYICQTYNKMCNPKKKLKPHLLRHSFAKYLLSRNLNIIDLKNLLGHSKLETTMIYAQRGKEESIKEYFKKIKLRKR